MDSLEKLSVRTIQWIGSPVSLVVHTVLFVVSFGLVFFDIALDRILLVVTTIVSLEAIYLAIFIQLSINHSNRRLYEVEKGIDEIQEDVEEIQEDVEEIQEDVEGIQEDVEEIQEDETEEERKEREDKELFSKIENQLMNIVREIEELKKKS